MEEEVEVNPIGLEKEEVDTPALLIDLDLMEENLSRMRECIDGAEAGLRAHTKVHRCPSIAHRQLASGARGICCQKVGEAEAMVKAGVNDVVVTNEIVTSSKMSRLLVLSRKAAVAVPVDSVENAQLLSKMALKKGAKLDVLIDVHLGSYRCGVEPGRPAAALARAIGRMKGVNIRGVMGFEGHISFLHPREERRRECRRLEGLLIETKKLIERFGIPLGEVSTGTTGTYDVSASFPGVTEVQAGSYVLMDSHYHRAVPEFHCALSVLSTVISRPSRRRAITDSGLMSLSTVYGLPAIVGLRGVEVKELHAENTILEIKGDVDLHAGGKVEFHPSYLDGTVNLHETVYGVRGGRIEVQWRIAGRGRSS